MSIENAVASTDIKHLTRQFYAAKSLIISQQETIKHYSQKDFDTNERRIKALQQSINSEREMNAKLTAEIAELEKENAELLSLSAMSDLKRSLAIRDLEQQAKAIKAALNDFMCDEYSTQVYVADLDRRVDELTRRAAKLKG